jgi:hypothetical protein
MDTRRNRFSLFSLVSPGAASSHPPSGYHGADAGILSSNLLHHPAPPLTFWAVFAIVSPPTTYGYWYMVASGYRSRGGRRGDPLLEPTCCTTPLIRPSRLRHRESILTGMSVYVDYFRVSRGGRGDPLLAPPPAGPFSPS